MARKVTLLFDDTASALYPFQVWDDARGEVISNVLRVEIMVVGSYKTPPAVGRLVIVNKPHRPKVEMVDIYFDVLSSKEEKGE